MDTSRESRPERLAFNYPRATVPARSSIRRDPERRTFASALRAEPRDWGYAGLFLFTAAVLLRPQDTVPALAPLHVAEVFAFAGILPMLLHRFTQQYPTFRVNVETLGVVAFGLVMLATVPTSIWPGGAFGLFSDMYVKVLIVFILMMNTVTTSRRLERLVWLIVVCLGIVAARGVADYLRGVNLVEGDRLAGPVGGILGNPNDLALNMVTFVPAAVVLALSRHRALLPRLIAAAIVLLMMATIVFTKSRSGALGLVAAIGALIVLGRRVRAMLPVMLIAAVVAGLPFAPASFWERMASITNARLDQREFTGSREARQTVMREGLEAFATHPLTGVGAGQFTNYNPPGREERWRQTHNALIQVAADLGIFGLLVFAFLIVRGALAARATHRLIARIRAKERERGAPIMHARDTALLDEHAVAMTAGLAAWFVCSLFASVAYNWTFYYLLALTVAARELAAYHLREAATDEIAVEGKSGSLSAAAFSTEERFHPA